ncbi:uncharacterized protein LOC124262549 [Haliotis rubra]|uniref:uncharacterized protein LOC124262549 n=1 Tax=Haliotis rubra TaxID=36100 RepID=UPI001EE586DD|nr:uncharacterized protein LOC124262549 [Haliotis rubra]
MLVCIVEIIKAMKTCTMFQIIVIMMLLDIMLSHCFSVCGPNQFFDVDSHMCDFCDVICDHPELQDTLVKCQTYCPAFLPTSKPTTTSVTGTPSRVVDTSTSAPLPEGHLPTSHVVLIALGSMIVLVAALGILGILFGDRLYKMVQAVLPRKDVDGEPVKYPIQEVGAWNHNTTNTVPVPTDLLIPTVTVAD